MLGRRRSSALSSAATTAAGAADRKGKGRAVVFDSEEEELDGDDAEGDEDVSMADADEDALAAAVVAPMRVGLDRCAAGLVIDRRDLKRHGAAVAWRHGAQWQIRTARPFGPTRRWQVPPDVAHD